MDKAYFVGKREILNWINTTLQCNVEKVEDAHAGWVYCQMLDACFPGQVPLHRVNFSAKTEYEKLQNLKILQDMFGKLDIKRAVDIKKLVNGKFQDNMEFCQWLKHYHGIKAGTDSQYPAEEIRNSAIAAYSSGHKHAAKSFQNAPVAAAPSAPAQHHAAAPRETASAASAGGRAAAPSKPAAAGSCTTLLFTGLNSVIFGLKSYDCFDSC
jgi:RP/EB family microtubule-associated protein